MQAICRHLLALPHVSTWFQSPPISIHTYTHTSVGRFSTNLARSLTPFFPEDLVTNKVQEPTTVIAGVVYGDGVLRREGGREGGREKGREKGREGGREGGREERKGGKRGRERREGVRVEVVQVGRSWYFFSRG